MYPILMLALLACPSDESRIAGLVKQLGSGDEKVLADRLKAAEKGVADLRQDLIGIEDAIGLLQLDDTDRDKKDSIKTLEILEKALTKEIAAKKAAILEAGAMIAELKTLRESQARRVAIALLSAAPH